MNEPDRIQALRTAAAPLDAWLDPMVLEQWGRAVDPAAVDQLTTYVGEAAFFWSILRPSVLDLPPGARVLEIGAGIGLLSLLLSSGGAEVVAYEPEAAGFDLMDQLAAVVEGAWIGPPAAITRHRSKFPSDVVEPQQFDMAVAINVIEHVPDPGALVAAATRLLAPTGKGYFVCPNYTFPYEPHFGIPTLVSKRWTERLFAKKIAASPIHDAEQFWADLSWPTVGRLTASMRRHGVQFRYSDAVLEAYVRRLDDPIFVERKGAAFRFIARTARTPAEWAIRALPQRLAPNIFLVTEGAPAG